MVDAANDWINSTIKCVSQKFYSFIDEELELIFNDVIIVAYYLQPVYQGTNLSVVN